MSQVLIFILITAPDAADALKFVLMLSLRYETQKRLFETVTGAWNAVRAQIIVSLEQLK
jgi:hypothetical protein